MDTNERGKAGEEAACAFLIKKGLKVLERNFRIAGGEIDIIAQDRDVLVFVEVKTRKSARYGYPEESVGWTKRKRISKAARRYLMRYRTLPLFRFDIIAILFQTEKEDQEVVHIKDCEFSEVFFR